MSSLNVKYNNDKSRDYTNPNLPTGDPGLDATLAGLGAGELIPQLLIAGGGGGRHRGLAQEPGPAPGRLAPPGSVVSSYNECR